MRDLPSVFSEIINVGLLLFPSSYNLPVYYWREVEYHVSARYILYWYGLHVAVIRGDRHTVMHWSWLLCANIIYILFFNSWLMESSLLRSLWCHSRISLDLGYLIRIPHPSRYLTQPPLYPVQHTLAVGLIFVIVISFLSVIFKFKQL